MLLGYAKSKNLKDGFSVPIMTPNYLRTGYFVTSTSYKLASALVSSMKVEVVCETIKSMNYYQ
jgi:hypothetical protein